MRVILFVALLMFPAGYASAVFYNNTETIEIGDGEPPEPSPDSTTDSGTVNPGGSSGGGSGSSGAGSVGGGSTGGGSGGSTGGSTSGSGSTGVNGAGSVDSNESGSDVIEVLIASGALSGVSSSASGSAGASVGGAGGPSVRVVGSRVREALFGNLDLTEFLTYWRKGKGKATDAELGLIAASTALRDSNVQEILFTASSFEIVYRSRGYLLAVLPWSFPVRLTVVPDAPVIEERVRVTLPWYRFFVRKFFTVGGLQRDVDELLTQTKAENIDGDADGTALLFEATAEFLRKKVGTVADSVLLGTPTQ